ncbi:MAG: phosphate/phosphite/phosphonate ABC transporter substrate-binding protein [Candidatus Riflebacteria bacterium]|jgi:phosphonate transport system substrate-binding protein|nr:phosphate/phosphite/phosphonate ABC transporter substrate-binding protein [Candidatus Riflebacteria bacterium]
MKYFLTFILLLLTALGVGWFFARGPEPVRLIPLIDESSPVYLGVIPFLQPEKLKEQIDPVCQYLQKKLGRKVFMVTASDYESLARLLELNKVHIAWFSHASFEKLRGGNRWQAICRPKQNGSVIYDSQIIVNEKSEFNTVNDLRGKVFAYVDRYSGSGFFFPNIYFSNHGIKPLEFFSKVEFTQSHRSSILGVLNGIYDAAAVYSTDLVNQDASGLRVIARTGPIPNDPIVLREDMEPALKKNIEEALLSMHQDPDGIEQLKKITAVRGTEKFVAESEVQKILQSENH